MVFFGVMNSIRLGLVLKRRLFERLGYVREANWSNSMSAQKGERLSEHSLYPDFIAQVVG